MNEVVIVDIAGPPFGEVSPQEARGSVEQRASRSFVRDVRSSFMHGPSAE